MKMIKILGEITDQIIGQEMDQTRMIEDTGQTDAITAKE